MWLGARTAAAALSSASAAVASAAAGAAVAARGGRVSERRVAGVLAAARDAQTRGFAGADGKEGNERGHSVGGAAAATDTAAASAKTVDAAEISKFAAMAAQWWDADGAFKPLLQMSAPRVAFLRAAACRHFGRDRDALRPLDGLRVLDVGCGGGLLAEPLARLGARMTAVDAASESVTVAKAHAAESDSELVRGIEYLGVPAEELVAEGRSFDLVTSLEVIEHVKDPQEFLRVLRRLVAPGGAMALSTINRTPRSYAMAIGAAEHVLGMVPVGTHEWHKFVAPEELAAMLARADAEMVELAGIEYSVLGGRWALSDDTGVNYICFATPAR